MKKYEKFIEKCLLKYNQLYDYSKVNYINSITKVEIICKIHGSFFVRPDAHLRKVGCSKCNGGIKYNTENFIIKAKVIHGNRYDYSNVNYRNSLTKIEIKCHKHGIFHILPKNHLIGQGCADCAHTKQKTTEIFLKEAILIHGNKYDYSNTKYINNRVKIQIKCDKHGIFYQNPKDHLNGHGCSNCSESIGEKMILTILIENNIKFIRQHTFNNCRGIKKKLPFDFYLPDYNILIEFDGKQHFESIEIFGGKIEFEKLKINDDKKNRYCFDNNIKLFRIKYNSVENDMRLLNQYLYIT